MVVAHSPRDGARARAIVAALGLLIGWSRPGAGQTPPGRVEERVTSLTDSSQTYALYLPPGYAPERRWPVLFVLDPRGRGVLGLALFRDAAARLGWIVMSSYNTLSDGPVEPNVAAMNAMLASAQARLAVDSARVYLAGFSGTARVAARFAVALRGRVAGVIAVGGALGFELGGPETTFAADSTFAYFGAAGTRDFNYEEVLALGDRFRATRVPFRIAVFEGPHGWPPAAICGEALEWLELRAMIGGRRAVDSGWVRTRLEGELARAAETLTRKLRIAELQHTVEHGDSLEAASSRRLLARTFVFLSFYEPRFYLASGAPDRAARMFEAAVEIDAIQGEACALLRAALGAATPEQRERLSGQCPA